MATKKSNNSPKKNLVTQEGYDKLISELEERKVKFREDIANKLQQATEQGDLSENAAYKTALEEKELNENRIADLEELIANTEVMLADSGASVGIGDKVTIKYVDTAKTVKYTIVGQSEANPAIGNISIESPIGKAIFGRHKGDKLTVNLPVGEVKLDIVNIE